MNEGSAFVPLGEETIYKSWISFAKASFRAPDGTEFTREVLRHPGGVCIVPVLEDGDTVLMVRQFRAGLGRNLLEIPAGKRDVAGESPVDTASRELIEETGMRAGRIELLCNFYNSPALSNEHHFVFLARDLVPATAASHSIEEMHMTVERVRLRDFPQLLASATIVDAKSIIGLMMASERLASEAASQVT